MRLQITLVATALSACALALPAQAQGYRDACRGIQRDNQVAGAVIGGILGGVLGSNVAGRGVRDEGTALGAVVGAVAGSEMGRGSQNCDSYSNIYPPAPAYPVYGSGPYGDELYGAPAPRPGHYYEPHHETYGRNVDDRYDLAGYDTGSYIDPSDYAGRECAGAKQITRLPDGTEIHKPVEACRRAYYGEWEVED
jgi:hypothetical protein